MARYLEQEITKLIATDDNWVAASLERKIGKLLASENSSIENTEPLQTSWKYEKLSNSEEASEARSAENVAPEEGDRSSFRRYAFITGLLLLLLLITIGLLLPLHFGFFDDPLKPPGPLNLHKGPPIIALPTPPEYEACPYTVSSKEERWSWNLTSHRWQTSDLSFYRQEFPAPAQEVFKFPRGQIRVRRGHESQISDIEMVTTVRSSNKTEAPRFAFMEEIHGPQGGQFITFPSDGADTCTDVQMVLSLRPGRKESVDQFYLTSGRLDVVLEPNLGWEIDDLMLGSVYGNIYVNNGANMTNPLKANGTGILADNGTIYGDFSNHGSFYLESKLGDIAATFWPTERKSGGDFAPWNTTIKSTSGDVTVVTHGYWSSQWSKHAISISTESGNIQAKLGEGAYTNIKSTNGSITAHIRTVPFRDPDTQNELYAATETGDINFWVDGFKCDKEFCPFRIWTPQESQSS